MMLTKTQKNLIAIPVEHLPTLWPRVEPLFESAYKRVDIYMPEDLLERLTMERSLLWVVSGVDSDIEYAFITELSVRPSGTKVCKLVVGAGRAMADWLPLQGELERYARAEGCSKIVAEGRPGWARALHGYKEIRRVIEKDL